MLKLNLLNNMNGIIISNNSFFDKDYWTTFCKGDQYKFFSINDITQFLGAFYLDRLREVLGNKVDETFKDFPLTKEQTEQIKTVFENQIDMTLPLIEPVEGRRYKSWTLDWKGKSYDMNLSLISPQSMKIQELYKIMKIAEECLAESKPMYISIDSLDF
ncbi:hypothetical protein QFZ37_001091 [Chryseobacterium ginsenosidimutans]|uniref:hypothetical protein n=1 Tax=Chryseobacterium ginsenosidimutans TaxID=687846 RepID=UPI002783334B|nr:hypothetical protein [Chryseobacterium ginsenosidimutans]MDQ0592722.1 hypothetical protein [Chryseobacterium ginsenosidimutans]